jgi:uncharacterized protein YaaQ
MKLAICIAHNRDKNKLSDELVNAGFKFTIIGSSGGFLREGNSTFMIGFDEADTDTLLGVISQHSNAREQIVNVAPFEAGAALMGTPVNVTVGGAVVFILDVERFERY